MTTPPTGGAQTFLVDLCGSLVGRGWTVSVVTQPGPEQSVVESLRAAGADVRQDLWRAADLPEERAERLAAWVNARRPEVYVVSISPDAGWLALPLLDPGVATVSVAHNDVSAFYDPLCHYAPFIDCAVGVSEETHRKIVGRCGVPSERARQIAYGVRALGREEAEGRAREGADAGAPLRVGYVGRVVQLQKRVFDFVPLAAELRRLGVNFELHLVGDGEEREALEREFAARGLEGAARFWGWLPPEEVRARLLAFDAFVLLSEYEGLPVALLEAMGHAVVPVVTRIESGNAELVRDGENGFVVPVGEPREAAARLKLLAEDRARLGALRLAAWERAAEFSVGAMVGKYVDCFERVAAGVESRTYRAGLPSHYPPMPSCRSRYPRWARKVKSHLLAARPPATPAAVAPKVSCIACGGRRLTNLGRVPNFTAGLQGQPPGGEGDGSSLYACADCMLRFRVPVPTDEELMRYYGSLSEEECWRYEGEREVWHHVRDALRGAPGRSVLDVGCFRGDLLKFLGDEWETFGVEPSEEARREAQARGVRIIAESLDELRGEGRRFDAITLIDVIEHLPRPLEALRTLSGLLVPGGRLVVFTGSTDALSWRLAGLRYWYCAMPEHIAFFRPEWFRWAAPRLGCEVASIRRLAYNPSDLRTRLDESLKSVAYVGYHRLKGVSLLSDVLPALPVFGRVGAWESCWWTSARDHVLVTLTKEEAGGSQ